jgi:hypothetical protein
MMQTIHLNIEDKDIFDKVMEFIHQLPPKKVQFDIEPQSNAPKLNNDEQMILDELSLLSSTMDNLESGIKTGKYIEIKEN